MRSLRLDYAAFITEYRAALECSLHFKEFLQLSGISHFMLNDRLKTLAQRGVVLPKLRGMRNRPMGVKPKPKAVRKPSRRKPQAAATPQAVAPPPVAAVAPNFVICVGFDASV
jgi:hypothetical protein